jgi:YegS/Rv2252/BmrU family lipid kinase
MNENKKVLFIINKYAGTGYQSSVEGRIITYCDKANIEATIEFTQRQKHATELAGQAAASKIFDIVFAVGGDGTVNEVAQGLVHTKQTMGIIPNGSGNGLARHLGLSMNFKKSLNLIANHSIIAMDSFLINDNLSVNVSGIGFDGHVASLFAKGGKRGLLGYSKFVLKEFFSFNEFQVNANIDSSTYKKNAFVVAFANSSQFGNNARISPHASVCDGWLDVCFIRKVPMTHTLGFIRKMFTGKIDKTSWADIIKGKNLNLSFDQPMPYHVDGEAMTPACDFSIALLPSSIAMAVPMAFVNHV